MLLNLIKKRKIRILLALLSLTILLSSIQSSYAKYLSAANAIANVTISRWSIIVNNQDILNNSDFSSTIVPTFESNTHIANNIIAPTSRGSIQLDIDGTNTDVSYRGTIDFELSDDTTIPDIKITGYKINNDAVHNFTANEEHEITITHLRTDTSKTDIVIIYFEWIDGTGESMNNLQDAAATRNAIAKVNVNVDFVQITN